MLTLITLTDVIGDKKGPGLASSYDVCQTWSCIVFPESWDSQTGKTPPQHPYAAALFLNLPGWLILAPLLPFADYSKVFPPPLLKQNEVTNHFSYVSVRSKLGNIIESSSEFLYIENNWRHGF